MTNKILYEVIIELKKSGNHEISLDLIFDIIDDWLLNGQFDCCSLFLLDVPIDRFSTAQLLTILTATTHQKARCRLPERESFLEQVRIVIKERGQNKQRLLRGLE